MIVETASSSTATGPVARGPVRPLYAAAGLVLFGAAAIGAAAVGTGVWWVLLFAVLPDVALLVGLSGDQQPGQLAPRAVPLYNLLHGPAGPALLVVAAAVFTSPYWAVAAATWAAHIAFDRSVGYGLRDENGWQRG